MGFIEEKRISRLFSQDGMLYLVTSVHVLRGPDIFHRFSYIYTREITFVTSYLHQTPYEKGPSLKERNLLRDPFSEWKQKKKSFDYCLP